MATALAVWLVTLLAAPGAEAVPSVTFKCTPAPEDCTGWYRSNVSIEWTVLPSDAAKTGCANETLTTDTPLTRVYCSADDGSSATSVEVRIKVDKTPPVVTGSRPSRDADSNGWYNHAVGVEFSGSDLTSGIASCTATTYGGPDDATANVQGTCIDQAGNVSDPLGYGLKYDATAPAVTAARPERQPNDQGWFNRAVRFDIEASDGTSGIADCQPVAYGGPDSATASITGTCRDQAGNSASRSFHLKYDSTAPAVAGSHAARPPNGEGWYNQPVGVSFSGADGLSGVEACTATTYAGPDAESASVPGTCTDRAGNISPSVSFPIRYDATNPVVTSGEAGRAPNANGWYSEAVSVTFRGTDQTAGIESCETVQYAGPDSGAASVPGTCRDRAGNSSNPFGYPLKYDATAPTVTAADPDRPANANGWYNRAIEYTIRGTDETSGVAGCPGASYSGPDDSTASFVGRCTDRAGNVADREFTLKYDATAPTATGSQAAREPGSNGWYSAPVAITFSGSDGLSGVDSCATVTYSGPDHAAASAPGTCTDKAGNISAPRNHPLKYDATAPTVTAADADREANAHGWYNGAVAFTIRGTDATSGLAECPGTSYAGPDDAAASVTGTCRDQAGNSASRVFALKYDASAPTTTGSQAAREPGTNGWYNAPVTITFSGADGLSGVDSCPTVTYSGPDKEAAAARGTCTDKAGNVSAPRHHVLNYDATAPTVTGASPNRPANPNGWHNSPVEFEFISTDATSGPASCEKRTYTGPDGGAASLTGTCMDTAGNVSSTHTHVFKYDATAPTVTRADPDRLANDEGWYNRAVSIAFRGTDRTSGIDACTAATYRGPDSAAASVPGTCGDRAGNVSPVLNFPLKFDGTGPVVTGATADRGPDHAGWFVSPVRFDVTGTDALSGIDTCPPVTYTGPDGARATVAATCRDLAGNRTSRAFPLNYDATAPLLASVVAAGGDRSVSLSWQTSPDAESVEVVRTPGVDSQPTSVVYRGTGARFVDSRVDNGVRYEYELKVKDAAGNVRTHKVVGLPAVPVGAVETAPPPAPGPRVVPRTPPAVVPAPGSVLRAGQSPLLRWPRARRAAYYNVQLFRGGRKIMTAWPKRPQYRLKLRWTFRGERRRLAPGRYRWMVWPGYGRRSKADFGKRIVNSTFTVKRAGAAGT